MYAVRPLRYHPEEPCWQDFRRFSPRAMSPSLRDWLLDSGSLTRRLLRHSNGAFRVELLQQSWQRPHLSETRLLGMHDGEIAMVREVILHCGDAPVVFARSIMPASSLTGRLRHLRHFDDSSLGALLFSDPSMLRQPFQLAMFSGYDSSIPPALHSHGDKWGRRSRFEIANKPLLVGEIFLRLP